MNYGLYTEDPLESINEQIDDIEYQIDEYIKRPFQEHDVVSFCKLCSHLHALRKRRNDIKVLQRTSEL